MLPLLIFFLLVSLGLALLSRLGGFFSPPWVFVFSTTLTVLLARRRAASREPVKLWLAAAIVALGFLYMWNPGEYLAGNWDPGVYLAQGVSASSSRNWKLPDTAARLLPDEGRFEIYPLQRGEPVKTPGFYAPFRKPGTLIPQFFPLYSSLLGLTTWLGGIRFALRTDALCILLAALLLADTAMRISGRPTAGLIVLGLFGLHPVLIWFARFQTVESLSLLLWVVLLWAGTRMLTEQNRQAAFLACLSALLLPWSTPAAIPVSLGIILLAVFPGTARAQRIALATSSLLGTSSLFLFLRVTHHPYGRHLLRLLPSMDALREMSFTPILRLIPVGIAMLVAIPAVRLSKNLRRSNSLYLPAIIVLLTIMAAVISALLLPKMPPFANGVLALLPLPFWAWAAWGWIKTNAKQPVLRFWNTWVLAIALAVGLLFILWPMMPLLYPWAWKRWIWILFPTIVLYAGIGLSSLPAKGVRRAVVECALFLILMFLPVYHHHALAQGGEWRGFSKWIASLSSRIPDPAVVLAPKELATPLEFIFGHTVVPLYRGERVRRDFFYRDLCKNASPERPVVVISDAKPAWMAEDARKQALPVYEGEWIKPSQTPFGFRRQKRGFNVFIWTSVAPAPDALREPVTAAQDITK